MKRLVLLLLFCGGLFMSLAAQKIEVKEPQLVKEAGTEAYYPKFTPDGKTILLTSENYTGLKALNLETKKVNQLTSAAGAGWNTVISDDSKSVCYQEIDITDNNPIGFTTFYSRSLASQEVEQLTPPVAKSDVRPPLGLLKSKAAIKSPVLVYIDEDVKLVIEKDGRKTVVTPNGAEEAYIWPALSPDGKKIVYTVASLEKTFICDLSGKILADLGRLHACQWLNNDWVVGMDDKDDGHVLLSSNLVAVSADGKVKQDLTPVKGKLVAMYPATSPAGDKIAFNTPDGELYIMDVVVK